MKISQADLELFAARIRPHFEPELRDAAYELALGFARIVGPRVKQLRPETSLSEIFRWLNAVEPFPDSLDQVEWLMAFEEEFGVDVPDSIAAKPGAGTFRDLVIERAHKRAA